MARRWIVLLALLVSLFGGTTTSSAAAFAYDFSTNARADIPEFEPEFEAAGVSRAPVSGSRERSAAPSVEARGASATPDPSVVATNRADDVVGSHGSMPRPRPAGMESHHGVNSVWAEANIPGYRAADAPAVLMPSAGHNATRGVFNRWRSEIAGRQGVPIRDIDWAAVSPGSAWSLAEEQFAAAGTAASTIDDYFAQWNRYLDGLRGGM
jgi:hypothetical protein